jgi:5'-3' exonuclease
MSRTNYFTQCLPLLHRALSEEIGIAFAISGMPRETFRNQLYEARKASQDPRLDALIIFAPAGDHSDELWICKKEVEMEETPLASPLG